MNQNPKSHEVRIDVREFTIKSIYIMVAIFASLLLCKLTMSPDLSWFWVIFPLLIPLVPISIHTVYSLCQGYVVDWIGWFRGDYVSDDEEEIVFELDFGELPEGEKEEADKE